MDIFNISNMGNFQYSSEVIDFKYLKIGLVCIQIDPKLGNGHVHDEYTPVKWHT